MKPLPPGERVVRCLSGDSTDRIPFGVGIGWQPWGQTLARWRAETGRSELNAGCEFGFDRSFAVPELESGIFPRFEERILESTDAWIVTRNAWGITSRNLKDGSSMPEFLDYPVKTPEDWEHLKAERLTGDFDARIRQDWDAFRARIKARGEAVQVGTYPWGVFGAARNLMGAEELLIGFYTEPDMIKDMMRHLTGLWLGLWERVAAEVSIDHIHIWEDMSGRQGSLISPAMVETFMMPCYDRIAEFARAHNVRILSVDTDGDCSELVPLMMRHGINMFFPFEVQAGNDIRRYRELYPELGIMDGLDKRALAKTRSDIDREMDKASEMVKKKRYVPGFDHLIPPDVPWVNFAYAAERLRDICHRNASSA